MKKNKTKKAVIILVAIVIVIAAIIAAAHLLINIFEENIIAALTKRIEKNPKIDSVKFGEVDINLFKRSITIENLSIDTTKELKIHLPVLEIEGISVFGLIFGKIPAVGRLSVKTAEVVFPGGFYTLKVKELLLSRSKSSISINSLEMIPAYGKYRFSRKRGYRSDRVELKIDAVTFRDVDFKNLLKKKGFYSRLLTLESPRLSIFRDRNVSRSRTPKKKKFPQQLLRELKFILRIDKIKISQGRIAYAEHNESARKAGEVFFSELDAEIKNVTNDPRVIKEGAALVLSGAAKLNGKAVFRVHMAMPLDHKNNSFQFSGSIGRTNLKEFRTILENNARLRIRSGILNKFSFSVRADNSKAAGEMRIHYKNFKISVLKKGKYTKAKFRSFLANTIIPKNNPRSNRPLRIGRIYLKREERQSFFTYILK